MAPLKTALIGCGRRGGPIYFPILRALRKEIEVVAVCDRQPDAARVASNALGGVPAYDSIETLVRDRPMEAAIVVTPISSHHAISCYLSQNKIHHLVETPICDTLAQARGMVNTAQRNGVIFRVGEQFFREPFDVLSRKLITAGVIGSVGRITNYHAHLGYHNNSRHQVMTGSTPVAVNAVFHTMQTDSYTHGIRKFDSEVFHNITYRFANEMLVTDLAGNIKGSLGRYARPGYHEIDGSRGTIIQQATGHWDGNAEVRIVPKDKMTDGSGAFSISYPFKYLWRTEEGKILETDNCGKWNWNTPHAYAGVKVMLPEYGEFRVDNEFAGPELKTAYHSEVAGHVWDFARLVRTGHPDPFTPEMAITSLAMERAAELSARRQGRLVNMDDASVDDIDRERLVAIREELGVDPLDIEAMLRFSFPQQ